jgi:hypothetical protein
MDEVKQEIKKALEALGYKDFQFEIATASFHRLIVWVNDVRIGIYDLDRHTFVD